MEQAEPMRKPRVLLVDDERGIRVAMQRVLASAGFSVQSCESGEHGLQLMTMAAGFDVIITDLKMPGLQGTALIRALRAADAQVPIVVLTGNRDSRDLAGLRECGVSACMDKPVDVALLLETLRKALKT